MNHRNYQKELDRLLEDMARVAERTGKKKTLFLHCCCAPCSSYVLEYLSAYFDITIFFYNPNITEREEYEKRKQELKRLLREAGYPGKIVMAETDYDSQAFFQAARGLEQEPECGERCRKCYEMRLRKTAQAAKEEGADFFCTTLSISPHKNADWLMEIGERLAEEYGIFYLPSDFKKRNGYKRSIELSAEYGLYRQNYCGCVFSRREADEKERGKCK